MLTKYLSETGWLENNYQHMDYKKIFENNRRWAAAKKADNSEFFSDLTKGQSPEYLFIGCSDSRVPLESITGFEPGEAFVHRNIANVVSESDPNLMAVVDFAVNTLKVRHIVVFGHSHCGGVLASLEADKKNPLNSWLNNIRKVQKDNFRELDSIQDDDHSFLRLIELNTIQQCRNILDLDIVKSSIQKSSIPSIHAWIFDIETGELRDLNFGEESEMI